MVDTGPMRTRPVKPRPVTVHNSTGRAFVYTDDGRVIGAGERRENVDSNDPTTNAAIRDRSLHVIEENK